MTQIENALRDAGVELPNCKERVWKAVKESMPNGMSSSELKKRLSNVRDTTVYTSIFDLFTRGMLYRAKGPKRGFGARAGANDYIYFTDMESYKLLPRAWKKHQSRQKAMGFSVPEVKGEINKPKAQTTGEPIQVVKFVDIDHLTIAEAKDLWRRLNKLFGN